MNDLDWIVGMLPIYFIGIMIYFVIWKSEYKDLLRIQKSSILNFLKIMGFVTIVRAITFFLTNDGSSNENLNIFSLLSVLGVFWEDLVYVVPLVLFKRLLNFKSKIFKAFFYLLVIATSISFGSGHLYQGMGAVALLSFYVPFTMFLGERKGFGTVIIAHILYDFITILTIMLFG